MSEESQHYYEIEPISFTGGGKGVFTYAGPAGMKAGQIVSMPLGRRASVGVIRRTTTKPSFTTRPLSKVILDQALPAHLLSFADWLANYYSASISSVWQTILPSGIVKKRRARPEAKVLGSPKPPTYPPLNAEQLAAIKLIEASNKGCLLQGITGSGKTRVYMELAERTLAGGQSVIVLVPEIALTPQIIKLFEERFPGKVLSTHSRQTEAERADIWNKVFTNLDPGIVIGPRSALFLPVAKPGLIIIDECHESSYKQEQNPRYSAIVAAAALAGFTKAKLVLGSATPGLFETYLAEQGRLTLVKLTARANNQPLPETTIVDLRDRELLKRNPFLSGPLIDALATTLQNGRQSLLYINRRGSASSQICGDCGWVNLCPDCGIPYTFHADSLLLICHYCNKRQSPPAICPDCEAHNMRFLGGGTKRIEAEVAKLFPRARLARLDKDSADDEHLAATYAGLAAGKVDILIGTQMIAKGLDLAAVDLVGVVSADTMLHIPDYSASERTFQLVSQVSGRAGRGDRAGQVIVQTYTPEHPAITLAAKHDFWGFYKYEIEQRKLLHYPPFKYLCKLTIHHTSPDKADQLAKDLAAKLLKIKGIEIIGPAPAFRDQLRGKSYRQIILKSSSRASLVEASKLASTDWAVDLDPMNLL